MSIERQLNDAQSVLTESRCHCMGFPLINYEAGVTWIECAKCGRIVSVPDFDIQTLLTLWAQPYTK